MECKSEILTLAIKNSLPCGVADACTLRAVSSSAARAVAAAPALRVVAGVSPTSAREWSTVHAMAQAFCVPALDLRVELLGD